MITNFQLSTTLHNGDEIPWYGLGVFKVGDGPELESVKTAIQRDIGFIF
jgi:methylglyoxal/glyoxal reductase